MCHEGTTSVPPEFGGRSKRSKEKLRNKKLVEVNFRSTVYFS
jgi:hypothetical protein